MMLSKDVCKSCIEKKSDWTSYDDDMFDKGRVYCPMQEIDDYDMNYDWIYVGDEPPENCVCHLEHTIMGYDCDQERNKICKFCLTTGHYSKTIGTEVLATYALDEIEVCGEWRNPVMFSVDMFLQADMADKGITHNPNEIDLYALCDDCPYEMEHMIAYENDLLNKDAEDVEQESM